MNSLVDEYTDRAIESELGLGGGKRIRMAGDNLGIGIDGISDLLFRQQPRQINPTDVDYFLRGIDITHGGSTPYKPMDADSLKKLNTPGSPMPPGMKEEILRQLGAMTRKA